jgi:hypothetical protein
MDDEGRGPARDTGLGAVPVRRLLALAKPEWKRLVVAAPRMSTSF